jgi:CheY-like chemotaxis protein
VAVGLLVTEALRLLRASIPTTIEIKLESAPGLGTVFADPSQLHQVIMNLCTNAYHAMEQHGGTLSICLERVDADSDLAASLPRLRAGHAYVCLRVSDTGIGMSRETLERVFDPFFSTKEPGKGTGLGLATVHGIVTSLHGDVRVTSAPGEGTEFQVYLPCVDAPAAAAPAPRPESEPPGHGEHILVVDDERVLLELGADMLRGLGYQVTVCGAPAEALEVLRAAPGEFQALLTDQTMPGMTGAELIRRLRSFAPTLPVVMVSGYSEALTPERLAQIGVSGFLQKPYTRSSLARILHEALHRRTLPVAK